MIHYLAEILPTKEAMINLALFYIIAFGFVYIVALSDKYRHLAEYFRYKFGKYF